jgi:cell division protease FtsH
VPSTIPPVDIPQEIRDRAHANSVPEEPDAGAVLTPPGAGGDIHGTPDLGPDTPTPPSPGAP